jgi:hypothetical protein
MGGTDRVLCVASGFTQCSRVISGAGKCLTAVADRRVEATLVVAEVSGVQFVAEETVELGEGLVDAVGGCGQVAQHGVGGGGPGQAGWPADGVVELPDLLVQVVGELLGRLVVTGRATVFLKVVHALLLMRSSRICACGDRGGRHGSSVLESGWPLLLSAVALIEAM